MLRVGVGQHLPRRERLGPLHARLPPFAIFRYESGFYDPHLSVVPVLFTVNVTNAIDIETPRSIRTIKTVVRKIENRRLCLVSAIRRVPRHPPNLSAQEQCVPKRVIFIIVLSGATSECYIIRYLPYVTAIREEETAPRYTGFEKVVKSSRSDDT